MRYLVALAVLLIIAGGCGSSDSPAAAPASTSPPASSPPPAPSSTGQNSSEVPLVHLQVTPSKDGRIGGHLYIAMGDSLSAGVGASGFDPKKGFVGLVHDALPPDFSLLNLGIAG